MPSSNITLDSLRKRKKYRETPLRYRVDDFAFVTVSGGIKATEVNLDTNYEGENIKIRGYPDRGLNLSLDWDDSRLNPLESTYSDQTNLIPGGRIDVLPYFNNTTNCSGLSMTGDEDIYILYTANVAHTLDSIAFYFTDVDPSETFSITVSVTPDYLPPMAAYSLDFSFSEATLVSGWNKFNFTTDDPNPYATYTENISAPLKVPANAQVLLIISNLENFTLGWNTDQVGYDNVIDPRVQSWIDIPVENVIPLVDSTSNKLGCPLFIINPTDDFKPQLLYGRYTSDKIPLYVGGSTTPIDERGITKYDVPSGGNWINYTIPESGIMCTFSGLPGGGGDNSFSTDPPNLNFSPAGIFVKPNPLSLIVRPIYWLNMATMSVDTTQIHYLDGAWVYATDPSYRLVGVMEPQWVGGAPTLINSGSCKIFSNTYNKILVPIDSGDVLVDGTTQELDGDWTEIDNINILVYGSNRISLYGTATISGQGELTFKQLGDSDDPLGIAGLADKTYVFNSQHCLPGAATNGSVTTTFQSLEHATQPKMLSIGLSSEIGLAVRTDSTGAVLLKDGLYKGARIKGWVEM